MDKSYCEFCNDFEKFNIETEFVKEPVNGIEVKYKKERTYCAKCKNEIFVNEVMDNNVLSMQKTYREKAGIITVEQIESIIDMYGIGKRNLSKLLGFGEITLTRYLDNDIPTRLYSEMLFKVFDYNQMLVIAKENKHKVDEKVYNKLMDNINVLIQSENKNKLIAVAKYIIAKTKDVTNLSVQKMLYLCQIVSVSVNNKLMFSDLCEAWKYGPVYPTIYYKLSKYARDYIDVNEFDTFNEIELDAEDKRIVDAVIASFGVLSGSALISVSHKTEPWKRARVGVHDLENSNAVITNKSIKEYAKSIATKYDTKDVESFCIAYRNDLLASIKLDS